MRRYTTEHEAALQVHAAHLAAARQGCLQKAQRPEPPVGLPVGAADVHRVHLRIFTEVIYCRLGICPFS